jgi:hypothetical protein
MPGKEGSGMPFQLASWERTSGTAFWHVPSQKYSWVHLYLTPTGKNNVTLHVTKVPETNLQYLFNYLNNFLKNVIQLVADILILRIIKYSGITSNQCILPTNI